MSDWYVDKFHYMLEFCCYIIMNGKGDENVLFREQLNYKMDRRKILKSSQITMIK